MALVRITILSSGSGLELDAIAKPLDGLLDLLHRGLSRVQPKPQRLLHHRNLNVGNAFQAFHRTTDLAGAAWTVHALNGPLVWVIGYFGICSWHEKLPSSISLLKL